MVYQFEMTGVIKNAVDGSPVAGVLIEPEPYGGWVNGDSPVVTGSDGRFSFKFSVDTFEFSNGKLPTWTLKLSKTGFEDETIEITPTKRPESGTTTQIMMFAFVRPSTPVPQPALKPAEAMPTDQ